MNSATLKIGWLRRKVEFTFNLAALKSATAAIRMDLGEFYTSPSVTEEIRFFYLSYGAWLNGCQTTPALLNKYAKMFKRFTTEQMQALSISKSAGEIMSEELQKAVKTTGEKKN